MTHEQAKDLKSLGSNTTTYKLDGPSPEILETFPNAYPHRDYLIVHQTDEFTSLCPKTGQPDYAEITISYVADERCVESKSLKLYLMSYRNHGCFMETIVNMMLEHLVAACQPRRMLVTGDFKARGGVGITVSASYEDPEGEVLR